MFAWWTNRKSQAELDRQREMERQLAEFTNEFCRTFAELASGHEEWLAFGSPKSQDDEQQRAEAQRRVLRTADRLQGMISKTYTDPESVLGDFREWRVKAEELRHSIDQMRWALSETLTDAEARMAAEAALEAVKRASQKRLQDFRHAENRQFREEALAWWHEHKNEPGMTKDRAAELIAKKVVPAEWRTVRDYLKGA
jgi:hypothetical protein